MKGHRPNECSPQQGILSTKQSFRVTCFLSVPHSNESDHRGTAENVQAVRRKTSRIGQCWYLRRMKGLAIHCRQRELKRTPHVHTDVLVNRVVCLAQLSKITTCSERVVRSASLVFIRTKSRETRQIAGAVEERATASGIPTSCSPESTPPGSSCSTVERPRQ